MKVITHTTRDYLQHFLSWSRTFLLVMALAVLAGGVYFVQVNAQSTGSSTESGSSDQYHSKEAVEYCQTITPSVKNNACKDGWDNKQPCSNYQELNFDPSIAASDLVSACERARGDQPKCQEAAEKKTTAKETFAKCPKIETDDTDEEDDLSSKQLQSRIDALCKEIDTDDASEEVKNICKNKTSDSDDEDDEEKTTEEEIEELKKAVEALEDEAEPPLEDNQYGQYVNGANQYQAIRVNRASGDNRPAIVLFHGGGWRSDDGAADKFAPHANERGYTTFVATYRLGSSGVYYQLDDALRAIQHVRNNAGMYGIDPSRIAVWGDSAGGSLAVRAASSGKTGVKAQVGWSAPTNAYTALFHSARSFAVGMEHSTCAPTDLAGINNTLTEINTGEPGTSSSQSTGNVALDVLNIATQAQETSTSIEEISAKMEDEEGQEELSGNVRRLAAKKIIECIDNFNTTSPALFAKAGSPPGFFAGYDKDPLVHPGQAFQMRDKLRALGVPSEALILPVEAEDTPNAAESAIGLEKDGLNHLGYHEKFVAPTLDFIDKFLHP